MGVAIAEAALARGAAVTLIVGRVEVDLPGGARLVRAETTAAMGEALRSVVLEETPAAGVVPADAVVMAAAVADFRPTRPAESKLHRGEGLVLELEPTPDLLAGLSVALAARPVRPVLVGFAAETGGVGRAADKLRAKGVDLIVANDVSEAGSGFGTETNRVILYAPDAAPEPWPLLPKREVADRLLERSVRLFATSSPGRPRASAPAQEVSS
jgi:phosphopantothenoylcysteine decarboxylase/phosphopantothenate--cysteine ligase